MKIISCLSFCFPFFFVANLYAQQASPVFEGVPVAVPSDPKLTATLANFYVFDIPSANLQAHLRDNLQPGDEKQFVLQLPGIGTWNIAIEQRGLISASYRLRVDDGIQIKDLPGPGDITWKGRLVGITPSLVSLTVTEHFIFGSIHTPDGIWFIEPLSDLLSGGAPGRFIVYRTSDVLPNPALTCGTMEVFEKKEEQVSERQVGDCKHIELAIASDFGMFTRYVNIAGVEAHNIGVMNEVATDYDDSFNDELIYVIVTQFISTTSTSSLETALTATTDADILLPNFRTWGNAGNFGVTFDLAQLWVTRNICTTLSGCGVVGLAYTTNAVCGNNRYHLLEDFTNGDPIGWQLRVLTSHEIGHNFSCSHDPAGSGTIMSPSVNNTTTWSAQSMTQLNALLTNITCLSICGANFEATAYSTAEGMSAALLSPGAPGCEMNYTELVIPVVYSGTTAGGSVTVSATGGTAVEGLDFDIPNSTITFPGGSTTQTENLIIRIWNDAHSESNESIELELSGGDAGGQNTATVTIQSDDINPVTGFYHTGQIGSGNAGGLLAPFHGAFQDCRNQVVINASELTAAGFAANDLLNGVALDVSSKTSTQPYSGFTIKMKHTTASSTSTGQPESSGFTTLYSASHTTSIGWNKFDFAQAFTWNGTSNLRIEFCYDNSSTSGNDLVRSTNGAASVFVEANSGAGCTLPVDSWSFFSNNRPNIRLYKGSEIAITLQDEANTNLKSGQTAYFKDAQNEFVLAIQHTAGPDPNCVNVEIDRAGSGRQSVAWLPTYFISDKTFFVTTDNPAATFDLTLYYGEGEVSVWAGETSTLNIITSSTPISAADASTASINESVVYAVFGPSTNTDLYRSYKATFTGMAGGFALTNAPLSILPVEWLDFYAKWITDKVRLTWLTAAEQNNAGFHVERSLDGIVFQKIGFVAGRGTSLSPQPYHFDDLTAAKTAVPVLYYRLQQLDNDGKFSYSRVVPVTLTGVQPAFLLYPNPSHESTLIHVLDCEECQVSITVTDAAGRVVLKLESADEETPIDLSSLPSGLYLADVKVGDAERWQAKLVKL